MHYGDDRTIREFYGGFKAWTDYLYRNSDHGIAIYTLYGDWAGPEPYSFNQSSPVSAITPGQYMSSGFNYFNAKLMARFAAVVGNEEDKAYYTAQLPVIAQAINDKYFNADTAQYALGSQAANTFALYLGIVPEDYEARVAKNIADDIIAHDLHLTTGNLCTKLYAGNAFPLRLYRLSVEADAPDNVSELGLYAQHGRNNDLGALGICYGLCYELAFSPDVRQCYGVVL